MEKIHPQALNLGQNILEGLNESLPGLQDRRGKFESYIPTFLKKGKGEFYYVRVNFKCSKNYFY